MTELSQPLVTFNLGHLNIRERLHTALREHPVLLVQGRDVARLGVKRLTRTVLPGSFYAVSLREINVSETCVFAIAGYDPEAVAEMVETQLADIAAAPEYLDHSGVNPFVEKLRAFKVFKPRWVAIERRRIAAVQQQQNS